jgi:undecaprenyl-diphosphatase
MLGLDRRLERWLVGERVGALNPVFRLLSEIGTGGAVWLALGVLIALYGRAWRVAASVAIADLVADVSVAGLQELFQRARPAVQTLVPRPASYSFPSGHAATSFACATVIASFRPALRLPVFLLAAASAWSRVYVGVHYPLDVAAGALYGAMVGVAMLRGLPRLAAARPRSRPARREG